MNSLVLSEQELEGYTKRQRPSAQARILRALGIPFSTHPVDRTLLVDREAARAALAGVAAKAGAKPPPVVNVEAIRTHGKETRTRGR